MSIRTYENHVIPGLLQTVGYAYAVMTCWKSNPVEVEYGLELRIRRQAILDGEQRPAFHAVIDEAALLRRVADTATMREQYGHLLAMAARPMVTLQVMPLATACRPGGWPFVIYGLGGRAGGRSAVYEETLTARRQTEDPDQVDLYQAYFDALSAGALDPAASAELIAGMAHAE